MYSLEHGLWYYLSVEMERIYDLMAIKVAVSSWSFSFKHKSHIKWRGSKFGSSWKAVKINKNALYFKYEYMKDKQLSYN